MTPTESAHRWRLLAAFAAVYLIWGSTYLAIKFAIETMPPLLMAGIRYCIAGGVLYGWTRWRGAPRPTLRHWRSAAIAGLLLLGGGNGGVVLAEQRVPSGLTALIVAIVPIWIALVEWFRPGGRRPAPAVAAGLVAGTGGLLLLVGPSAAGLGARVDAVGAGILVFATLSWAAGTIFAKGAHLPATPQLGVAMEMAAGGGVLLILAALRGEYGDVNLAAISARSVLALAYLIVFGALLGFSAYIYLVRNATPTRAVTYAYVNPVVAVFLGWLLGGEPLTLRTLLAAAIIVGAVVLITRAPRIAATPQSEGEPIESAA